MKIEIQKEVFFEKLNKDNTHHCENHESFSEYFEKSVEKNINELKEKQESEEKKTTSVFAEKKTGRRTTDIFDTLIDI